jgi:hypothetical protein
MLIEESSSRFESDPLPVDYLSFQVIGGLTPLRRGCVISGRQLQHWLSIAFTNPSKLKLPTLTRWALGFYEPSDF